MNLKFFEIIKINNIFKLQNNKVIRMNDFMKRLKALADETRLQILLLLLKKNICVNGLARKLDISESAVSQHLKILREADLVRGEKRGYFVHYQVKKENLLAVADYIEKLVMIDSGK